MPAIQTSYAPMMPITPFAGGIVDMRNRTLVSRELQTPTLNFGAVVRRGSADHTCADIGGGGAYLGISVLDVTLRPTSAAFVLGDTVAVMTKGLVWVTAAVSITSGASSYYDAGGNFTSASAGNTAIPGAVFESTAAAGSLVQLRLT